MADDLSVFKELKALSSELEQNLNLLEFEVSDATKLIYDCEDIFKTDSKGISILQDILNKLTKIYENLEKFQEEESDLAHLNEELDVFTKLVNEREKEQEAREQILIQQNLLQPEQSELSISEISIATEQKSDVSSSSLQCPPSCESTFLIPPPIPYYTNQTPDSVNSDFQSTICEFGYENISANRARKTFVVKTNL